jgi:hypothetical protein
MDINSTSNICTVYDTFDFSKFILTHPESLQGGSFFTKLNINNDILYVQTPKCISKQGIVSSSGKKSYIDLMFSVDDSKFIEFMENLEKSCVEKIHEKKNSWFTNDIDQNDIENAFTATLRPYKAGKYYLLRANIAPSKNLVKMPTCFVFDESENKLTLDDIKSENDLITVLEIQGIKITTRNFQIVIELKQVMVLDNEPLFENCLIKFNKPLHQQTEQIISEKKLVPTFNLNENVPENLNEFEKEMNYLEKEKLVSSNILEELDNFDDIAIDTEPNIESNTNLELGTNIESELKEENISLDFEDLTEDIEENSDELKEINNFDLSLGNNLETMQLKKPNQVYFELYKEARNKAKLAKRNAIIAYLEAKNIKKTYMIENLVDSDSDFDAEIDEVSESELEDL